MPQNQLFRAAALERLSSPERLDTLLQISSARSWLALVGLLAIVTVTLVWSFVGTIPSKVEAPGILVRPGGLVSVVAGITGAVAEMRVKEGDVVRRGQIIATIDRPGGGRLDVTSPRNGAVVEVAVDEGGLVTPEAPILTLQPETHAGLEAVIYVPPALGKTITPGMTVQVSPFGTPREEYGFMIATVTSVSEFPATTAGMMRVLGNDALVQSLSRNGAPFAVRATFTADPSARSGFLWSSRRGAGQPVNSGTLCSASIITRLQRPIDLVLPSLHGASGN